MSPVQGANLDAASVHTVKWTPADKRNWAEIMLFKAGEVISIDPDPDVPSYTPTAAPGSSVWCFNTGTCNIYIPDVDADIKLDGLSGEDYKLCIRQFFLNDTFIQTDELTDLLQHGSLVAYSKEFTVKFNIFGFYHDQTLLIYASIGLFVILLGLVGIGLFRRQKRREMQAKFRQLATRRNDKEAAEFQEQLFLEWGTRA